MFTSLSDLLFHFEDYARLCFQNALRSTDFKTQKEYFARYDVWKMAASAIREYQIYLEMSIGKTEDEHSD